MLVLQHRNGKRTKYDLGVTTGSRRKPVFANMSQPAEAEVRAGLQADPHSRVQMKYQGGVVILLVEDDILNQAVALLMLEKLGVDEVTVVCNGLEAVQAVASARYDMVLMDIMMPVMDGLEATRRIRNQEAQWKSRAGTCLAFSSRLPIVAMTACAMLSDRQSGISAGMDDHLSKPVSLGECDAMLQKWLPREHGRNHPTPELSTLPRPGDSSELPEATNIGPTLSILLVEDESAHAEIARRSLLDSFVPHSLTHLEDGQAALDYLHRENDFADLKSGTLPDLILLDLHLPKVDGLEVLRRIREDEELQKIPTVVLTTSSAPSDIDAAYALGAADYVVKPVSSEWFTEALASWPKHLRAC